MGRSRWLGHPLTLVVAGAVAMAAGAAIPVAAVGVVDPVPGGGGTLVSSAPSPSSGRGTSGHRAAGNRGSGTGGAAGNARALPPPGGSAGHPVRQLMIMGRVMAVSRTSITLSAHGQRITAAITRSTRITGRGRRVAAIRAGDTVSAQISEAGSPTVIAIQDPVSIP